MPPFQRLKPFFSGPSGDIGDGSDLLDEAWAASRYHDPGQRVAILAEMPSILNAPHPKLSVVMLRALAALTPTTPAPESSGDCQPSVLLPTYLSLFAR